MVYLLIKGFKRYNIQLKHNKWNHLINTTFVLSVQDVRVVVVMIGVDPIDPIDYWLLLGHQLVTNLKTPSVPQRYHLGITWVPLWYHLDVLF